jgi:hypothetical protein
VDCCAHHNFARAGRSARLFFGKIAGGRDLARSHFLFPVKEKRAVARKNRGPRFASGLPLVHLNEITLGHCRRAA